jgi:hypothetical protein
MLEKYQKSTKRVVSSLRPFSLSLVLSSKELLTLGIKLEGKNWRWLWRPIHPEHRANKLWLLMNNLLTVTYVLLVGTNKLEILNAELSQLLFNVPVVWDLKPCTFVGWHQRVSRTCHLSLQGQRQELQAGAMGLTNGYQSLRRWT